MGKSSTKTVIDVPNSKKYGVPLYGAAWVPPISRSDATPDADAEFSDHVVLAGGGGEGRSGIPNALLVSKFDFASNSLSDQPVAKLGTGTDLPYRMAVHPKGEGVICSLPQSCRWFEWDEVKSDDDHTLSLKPSEKVIKQLEDVGQQLALTFSADGSLLAVGGQDGKLRVFKWPSMTVILDEADAHASVKDLDFSPDGNFLVSVGSGPGRIWDIAKSTCISSLQKENDEVFGFCRFSRSSNDNQVLYITAMRARGGSILKWDATSWKKISSKHVVKDPVSSFNVSADGRLLAMGTIEGDILILSSATMRVQKIVRKAHLGLVTALMFSQNSRALVSASLDASARVTRVEEEKKRGLSLWMIIFVILLAVAVYYAKTEGIIP